MSIINLSYVLTTYNKLEYLSVTLPLLIQAKKNDEEIIVVDGGSNDGTDTYLQNLFNQGKINQFISQKDYGEAHGTNKAFLLAKGEIIKIITDDDVFHFPTIELCKNFMLKNKDIDMIGFDGLGFNMCQTSNNYSQSKFIEGFKKWKINKNPFMFCGLSYTIRKQSLAYMGLFNPNFTMVDNEYSIRISSMKTKICFYTGLGFVNIVNASSNSSKFYQKINKEKKILHKIYPNYKKEFTLQLFILKIKDFIAIQILNKKSTLNPNFIYKDIVVNSSIKLDQINNAQYNQFLY